MNVIIEGCDCVGKSSAVKELMKLDGKLTYEHNVAPRTKAEAIEFYKKKVIEIAQENNHIIDRAFLSECVYGKFYRGYDSDYVREMEKQLDNTILIVLTARTDIIEERFDGEGIDIKDIFDIRLRYLEQFELSNHKYKFVIDTSYIRPKTIAKIILNIKNETEQN